MDIFGSVLKGLFGDKGFAGTVADMVEKYWPPDVSPEKKIEFQLAMSKESMEKEKILMEYSLQQDKEFNKRMTDMEGTASDLKSIPFLGSIMLFLRGCQRPVWGFATIYLDIMWFSNYWDIPANTQKSAAFLIINIFVLVFLFGERALQNVMPYIIQFFSGKANGGGK